MILYLWVFFKQKTFSFRYIYCNRYYNAGICLKIIHWGRGDKNTDETRQATELVKKNYSLWLLQHSILTYTSWIWYILRTWRTNCKYTLNFMWCPKVRINIGKKKELILVLAFWNLCVYMCICMYVCVYSRKILGTKIFSIKSVT